MNKQIAIFGGRECIKEKESYYYSIAYELGKALARNSFVAITGAGPGLMDETLRGATEMGGETVGIGLNLNNRKQSEFASRLLVFDKLGPRQEKIIEMAGAYVALPGGIGTFYEIANILALKSVGEVPPQRPLILLGEFYREFEKMLEKVIKEGFAKESLSELYTYSVSPDNAIKVLNEYFNENRG
jgi:uncharacterized protein (TIGR00730 family)